MTFERDGYVVRDLGHAAVDSLCDLVNAIGSPYLDGGILQTQHELREKTAPICRKIVACERAAFEELLGGDIVAQKKPYLRIARPGIIADNIGFHKDTWYGGHPSEVTAWIPLMDIEEDAALRVSPGSHLKEFEVEDMPPQVEKGTIGHALGFLYAPKRLKQPVEMRPVPMRFGQMLVMSLALLHGQEENKSARTRWPMDCRVVSRHADIGERRASAYAPLGAA